MIAARCCPPAKKEASNVLDSLCNSTKDRMKTCRKAKCSELGCQNAPGK